MKIHRLIPACLVFLGIAAVAVTTGCSKKERILVVQNQRPTIRLTNAPVNSVDPVYYAYKLNWIGYDVDGRVSTFEYAIDPPTRTNADTQWVGTTRNEQVFFFKSTQPESLLAHTPQGQDFHVFVIRAVDNQGLRSLPVARAFFSYTVAPTVQIDIPRPSPLLEPQISPAVLIHWSGQDPDGVFTQKPVKYKFKLFKEGPELPFDAWYTDGDSLRRYYAPTFEGWDSTSAETTFKQYTNLTPGSTYLFVVVAFDEAGAYSPIFNRSTNMLKMSVGFAGNLGPIISMFNEFFFFRYSSGGYSTDLSRAVNLEVPAGRRVSFFWFAEPPPGNEGAVLKRNRWALDIADLDDQTSRTNERTDLRHWSQWLGGGFNGTVLPPFPGTPDEFHDLWIEEEDINGLTSLGWIHFDVVRASFAKPLLIVDDTRLNEDRAAPRDQFHPDSILGPIGIWPTASELDTFLYARGNFRWRVSMPPGQPQPQSPVGVFSGYPFDTLGTRTGRENPTIRLRDLGNYQNIIWMVDAQGSLYKQGEIGGSPNAAVFPMTTLRYMTEPNRQNTLTSWILQGGNLWVLGGGIGNATTASWNNRANDPQRRVYTSFGTRPELVPGRFMFDVARWRSEFAPLTGGVQRFNRIDQPDPRFDVSQPWDPENNPFWPGNSVRTQPMRPEYLAAPVALLPKTTDTDPLYPGRNPSDFYINTNVSGKGVDLEFLAKENKILEDPDGEPETGDEYSVLDTLYHSPKGGPGMNQFEVNQQINPTMTIFRGRDYPNPVIFTGFDIWHFRRQDCVQLVDFVLNSMWHMTRSSPATASRSTVRRPISSRHQ